MSDPFAPPSADPIEPADELKGGDLTRLNPKERQFLESSAGKPNLCWPVAKWLVAIHVFLMAAAAFSGGGNINLGLILKVAGYLALGYWARRWSVIAALLLLSWHVTTSWHFIHGKNLMLQLFFGIPTLLFLAGLLGAHTRRTLIRRTRAAVLQPPVSHPSLVKPSVPVRKTQPKHPDPGT